MSQYVGPATLRHVAGWPTNIANSLFSHQVSLTSLRHPTRLTPMYGHTVTGHRSATVSLCGDNRQWMMNTSRWITT